jgi:hypothetical protein
VTLLLYNTGGSMLHLVVANPYCVASCYCTMLCVGLEIGSLLAGSGSFALPEPDPMELEA